MKLLIDIGNSKTKAVLSAADLLIPVAYDLKLFEQQAISRVVYASVGHQDRAAAMLQRAAQVGARVTEVTTARAAFGVQCAYENYHTLGIDRWLAVLGAAAAFPQQNVIVVDAGTATTVDFLRYDPSSDEQQHLGGWIVPGLELMAASVAGQTVKVFDDDTTTYQPGFGDNTPAALKSGCLAAQLGLVRQAVNDFNREAVLLIAGGNGSLLLQQLAALKPIYDPMIVFKGLDRF
jgi:type III pantothenate kinase